MVKYTGGFLISVFLCLIDNSMQGGFVQAITGGQVVFNFHLQSFQTSVDVFEVFHPNNFLLMKVAADSNQKFFNVSTRISNKSLVQTNITFTLHNITTSDAGTYKANNTRSTGPKTFGSQTCFVIGTPNKPIIRNSSLLAIDGQNYTLSCETNSTTLPENKEPRPALVYNWTVNHKQLKNRTVMNGEKLIITILRSQDENATFRCNAWEDVERKSENSTGLILSGIKYGPENISINPKNLSFPEGTTLQQQLNCMANCDPCEFDWWTHESTHLQVGPFLTLNSLNRSDVGFYTCSAHNNYTGIQLNASVYIDISYGPDTPLLIEPNETQFIATEYSALLITCASVCSGDCVVQWNSKGIDGNLNFSSISRRDTGNYTCTATNAKTNITVTEKIEITVFYGPDEITFVSKVEAFTVTEGGNVNIECSAVCFPDCVTTWYRTNTSTLLLPNSSLRFENVNRSASGPYMCFVNNTRTRNITSKTLNLIVRYAPMVNMTIQPQQKVMEGYRNITIVCTAHGEPKNYNFKKIRHYDNTGSKLIREIGRELSTHDSLMYKFTTPAVYEDTGLYVCFVNNNVRVASTDILDINASVLLQVEAKPLFTQIPKTEYGTIGTNRTIVLFAHTYDRTKPGITWTGMNAAGDNRMIIMSDMDSIPVTFYGKTLLKPGFKISLTLLNIRNSDFGKYTVTLNNSVGVVSRTFLFQQEVPDETPSDAQESNVGMIVGIAVVISVIFVAVIAFVVMFYRQRSLPIIGTCFGRISKGERSEKNCCNRKSNKKQPGRCTNDQGLVYVTVREGKKKAKKKTTGKPSLEDQDKTEYADIAFNSAGASSDEVTYSKPLKKRAGIQNTGYDANEIPLEHIESAPKVKGTQEDNTNVKKHSKKVQKQTGKKSNEKKPKLGRTITDDNLIYVDVKIGKPKKPKKKATKKREQDKYEVTEYAGIIVGKVGASAPESDDEN